MLASVSIVNLHERAKLSSQLFILYFLLYKKNRDRHVTRVYTRSQQKYVFKTDTKFGKKYEHSPYYIGTGLWNKLSKDIGIQDLPNVYVFKSKVAKLYKCYNEKYV